MPYLLELLTGHEPVRERRTAPREPIADPALAALSAACWRAWREARERQRGKAA